MKRHITLIITLLLLSNLSFSQQKDPDLVFYENAKRLREAKKYAEAIVEYESAIQISLGKKPTYFFEQGLCYAYLNKNEQAVDAFEKALEVDPKYTNSYDFLVKTYKRLNNREKLIIALDRWSKNTDDKNASVEKKMSIISILLKDKKYTEALKHSQEGIEIDPSSIDALQAHAKVNNLLGNYTEAKNSAQKAANILTTSEPKIVSKVYFELGYALHYLEEYGAKDEAFKKANYGPYRPRIAKLYPPYFTNLARVYDQIFEYDYAEELLKEALKIDEYFSTATKLYAEIEDHKHPKDSQIDLYKRGIKGILDKIAKGGGETGSSVMTELYESYAHLIELKISSSLYEEAINASDEALQTYGSSANAHQFHFLKAMALFKEDRKQEALNILYETAGVNGLSPNFSTKYWFALGHINQSMGEYDKAKSAFTKALKGNYASAAQFAIDKIIEEEDSKDLMIKTEKKEPSNNE